MKRVFAVLALGFLSACGMAADGALIRANDSLADRDYIGALGAVDSAESLNSSPDFERRRLALKARIFEAKGDPVAAKGVYQYILDKYPNTDEGYLAKNKLK